ncbi:MAG: glycosyltransferase family 4 protein [Acidiferrobacteraceae bacterium]
MRILYTNFHPSLGGGHTTYVLNLFKHLRDRHEVQVAAPSTSTLNQLARRVDPDSVLDLDYPGKLKELPAILLNWFRLCRLLRHGCYDIVHVNGSPDHRLVAQACRTLSRKPAIIYTKHNSLPLSTNWFSRRRYRHHTDHIILVCDRQAGMFEKIGVPPSTMSVIGNGVDTSHFAVWPNVQRDEVRQRLGLSADDLVLISTAGTDLHKGWPTMVEAVSRVKDSRIKIIICGATPSKEVQARHVDAHHMQGQVIFSGFVEDVRPLVAAADAGFVLSRAIETISFACREMMAMAKPVLVSNYACLPDNIIPGKTGWVVAVGDVSAVAALVDRMRTSRNDMAAMGEAARRQVAMDFTMERFVIRTEQVYLATRIPAPV